MDAVATGSSTMGAAGVHVLDTRQRLPRPREEVFGFFADAGNLDAITPSFLHFRTLTPLPIRMRTGALIDYSIRLRGFPMRWRTQISVWEPPLRFVDEQLRGPYALWRHEHTFEEIEGGKATLVRDRVEYALPLASVLWGLPESAIHRHIVRPDLERIFRFRREALEQRFGER